MEGTNVTNTLETVDIKGSKTWADNEDQYKNRPSKIMIRLYAGDKEVASQEVAAANGWKWEFKDQPKYRNGKEVTYSIKEDAVTGYKTKVEGTNVTNTLETTSVSGSKTWDDNNNQDGKRPDHIILHLFANGTEVKDKVKVVTAENDWKWSFTDLPKYANGTEITYTVTEDTVQGYTTKITGNAANGFKITNTHTPELISIDGTKTWDDANNQDGKRPSSITINLLANGKKVAEKKVTADDNWSWSFKDQPKYANGVEIVYTITEDAVDGYATKINGYNVENSYTPNKISVGVTKAWNDANNQDGIRTNTVVVKLLADGKDTGKTLQLTAANNWTGTFTDLDEKKAGKDIVYTVKEVNAPTGYTVTITGDAKTGFIVTNSHTPETTEVSGSKTWNDANNQDGKRPSSITINLLANGVWVDRKEVKAADNWSWKFTNLPKNAEGKPIVYTVTEKAVADYTTTVSGYNVTNSYTPEETSISVTKAWADANNQDGIRTGVVVVELYAGNVATGKMLSLTAANSWTGSFTGLDKKKAGKDISYTVKEVSEIKGYTTTITGNMTDGYIITNSHTPEVTSISGSKTWNDANNQDGKRPSSITINLLANGKKVAEKKVTEDDNWSWKFDNLPKKEAGKEILYTVTEEEVADYTAVVEGYNVTNSYTPEKTGVQVTKAWNDGSNQDGIRPNLVVVGLMADGKDTGKTLILNAENSWSGSFTGLDKKKDGKDIAYTVKEVSEIKGYITTITGNMTDGYIITNSYTPETTEVTGSKTWKDADNQDGKRPASITINLLANGVKVDSKVVTEANSWSWKFDNLPKKENGRDIVYTITEETVAEYSTSVEGYNVTNSYTPGRTSISVTKAWADKENQDGIRTAEVTVRLYADGKDTGKTLVLKKDNHWSGSFTDLDVRKNGQDIVYTVREDLVPEGYTETVTGNAADGFVVTNSHETETTEVTGSKTWDDANNQDGKRPTSITINLLANGVKVDSKVVTEADSWSWKFENLPKKEAGEDIVYTITEEAVEEYSTSVDGYNVTNSYTPGKTSIQVTKAWEDAENQDGIRPEEVTVRLVADGEDTDLTLTLNGENNWSGSFTDLDEKKDGKDIEYTVKEDPEVSGYEAVVTGSAKEGYVVTNTHTPEVIEVAGTKTWNDDGQTAKRPGSITVHLFADGVEVDSRTVTAEDDWSWSFTELPKKVAGEDIVYTITEDAADGYLSEVKGYDVTNTITKVLVSKVDITDQKELEGAHIQIIDENGNVVEEWDSKKEPHAVTGLKTGVTYILRETVAPDGYELTTDTTFVLKEDGTVDTTKTTTTMKDGVLLVEDMPKPTPNTTVAVTKRLVTAAGDVITAIDQTFYVALYADSDCTKRISDVKALVFKNASSATVTFENVTAGVTYYVGECDKDGTSYLADVTADGTVYTVEFGSGNVVKVENAGGSSAVYFDNSFMKTPDGFYKEGKLTITKKLRDAEGNAINSEETFYAGIFADAAYTTLSDAVSENIIPLNLNGGSEASVQMVVPVLEGQTVMLYVTEVDAEGNPVEGTKGFAYGVEVEHGEVILSEAQMSADVTITNIKDVEKESESEETSESESTSKKTTTSKTAAKTGDDTPVGPLTGLLFASAAIIGAYMRRRRKAAK